MDPGVVVVEQGTFDLHLLLQVGLKLSVDVVHYGFEASVHRKTNMDVIRIWALEIGSVSITSEWRMLEKQEFLIKNRE